MRFLTIILLSSAILVMFSCSEETTKPTGNYSVSGKVIYEGQPLPDATISLNKRLELTVQSNSDGDFTITNVPAGDYTLTAEKINNDGSFLARSSAISVEDDILITSLILPKGVILLDPLNITATSMQLIWNPTDANDFREYKLYRHISSGLDENTGTLVHVATTINDTVFTDNNIFPLTTYYYRVYVMNDFGKLGGSNIVSSITLNKNAIQNGSFENVTSVFPDNWSTWGQQGKFLSDTQFSQEGNKSVKINLALADWGVNSWGMYQQIAPSEFEPGKTYRISFWCKTDTLEEYESISARFTKNNIWDGNEVIASLYEFVNGPRSSTDWEYFSFTLTIPTTIPSNYYLTFDLIRAGVMGYIFDLPMISWIDNVIIEKIP